MDLKYKKGNTSKIFDLLNNPFCILRIDPTTSPAIAAEAFEDAVADEIASELDLVATREVINNPRLRTAAEVAFLVDTPAREVDAVISALRSKTSYIELLRIAERLAPLSKANLLAHAAAHHPATADLLFGLVDAHAQVKTEIVHRKLESVRRAAGMVAPSLDTVRDELQGLFSLHAKATFAGYPAPKVSVDPVEECTRRILTAADPERVDALEGLMREFRQVIAPELTKIEEQFRSTAKTFLGQPNDASVVSVVSNQLRLWSQLARPMLQLDAHKGRDEARARQLFYEVRSLAIDLANDHQQFDSALLLSKLSAEHFSLLPRAAEQLKEDLAVLEERSAEKHVVPLKALIDEFRSSGLAMLLSDLKMGGFGEASIRETKELWISFSNAVKKAQETTASDLPWLILRGLAIEINNEMNEPLATKAILVGMNSFAERNAPSLHIINTIRDDLRTVERNILEKSLIEELKADRISPALETVRQLLSTSTTADEREPLVKIQGQLESKRNARYIKWGVGGIIAAVFLIANLPDKSPPAPVYRNPAPVSQPSYPTPPTQPSYPNNERRPPPPVFPTIEDVTEVIPQVGIGLTLSRSNIRYCQFQKERYKTIEADLRNNEEISAFNKLVDDFNSRCGNFRYREGDLNAVVAEVSSKSAALAAEGRSILLAWRQKSIGSPPFVRPQMPPASAPLPLEEARNSAPTTQLPDKVQSTNLLKLEDAMNVQRRLSELGYFKGPINGAWGPQSRASLRSFKASSGLSNDDLLDLATELNLFSASAVRASSARKPTSDNLQTQESQYPPPTGATLNPLNRTDATRIHLKLRDLGFYRGNSNTLWSVSSRDALKEFKIANSLVGDDQWDALAEQRLFNTQANEAPNDIRSAFEAAIGGIWSSDLRACPGGAGNTDALLLKITAKRAETEGALCEFGTVSGQGQNWKTIGTCTVNGQTWSANISLLRVGDLLTWASERGTAKYFRCNN